MPKPKRVAVLLVFHSQVFIECVLVCCDVQRSLQSVWELCQKMMMSGQIVWITSCLFC